MSDTTASIQSKGLDGTGFTEDIAAELFNKVGTHMMAIVDLQVVDRTGPNLKGKRGVKLVIGGIEPALDDNLAEHLRELTRTLFFNRQVDVPLDGDGINPDLKTALANGARHEPHPYLTSGLAIDDSELGPVCDVCGLIETAGVHANRDNLKDPFELHVVEDPEEDEPESDQDQDEPEDEADGDQDPDLDHGTDETDGDS
jgi:hypothetical protein